MENSNDVLLDDLYDPDINFFNLKFEKIFC